jgi:hypothetical protein
MIPTFNRDGKGNQNPAIPVPINQEPHAMLGSSEIIVSLRLPTICCVLSTVVQQRASAPASALGFSTLINLQKLLRGTE